MRSGRELRELARAVELALLEWRLDQAVASTFPCSDPIATSCLAERDVARSREHEPDAETLALCAELVVIAEARAAQRA